MAIPKLQAPLPLTKSLALYCIESGLQPACWGTDGLYVGRLTAGRPDQGWLLMTLDLPHVEAAAQQFLICAVDAQDALWDYLLDLDASQQPVQESRERASANTSPPTSQASTSQPSPLPTSQPAPPNENHLVELTKSFIQVAHQVAEAPLQLDLGAPAQRQGPGGRCTGTSSAERCLVLYVRLLCPSLSSSP